MKLPKKQAAVVRAALEEWRASGLLDEETGKRLLDDLTPLPFDWYRLGRYALWSALTCILIGVAALLGDELFLELISRLFVMTELGRSLFLILAAAGLFFWGVRRRRRAPQKRLTNEGLFFLGVLAIAGSLASLAAWLYAYGGEDIGFLNISSLFLLAAVIYGALGLLLDSRLIWVFALFAFGSWLGAETGYRSGWGAYYLGMNYPMRFVLLGLLLCGLSVLFKRNDLLEPVGGLRAQHALGGPALSVHQPVDTFHLRRLRRHDLMVPSPPYGTVPLVSPFRSGGLCRHMARREGRRRHAAGVRACLFGPEPLHTLL